MMKRTAAMLAALACTVAFAGMAASPASAQNVAPNRGRYAAVGDSYAAGVGNTPIARADCGRSSDAYPVVLAGAVNKVTFLACSGATVADSLSQVAMIPSTVTNVTVTVGGNDVDFVKTLTQCSMGPAECQAALGAAQGKLMALPGSLTTLVGAIHARAPRAEIRVTGYPILFQASLACAGSESMYGRLLAVDSANMALNNAIGATVASLMGAGLPVEYVDVATPFMGHGICSGPATWINPVTYGPTGPNASSLHPNVAGQMAYADAIEAAGFPN